LKKNIVELKIKLPWIPKEGLTGYSLRQAHLQNDKDKEDVAYSAAISVTKACHTHVVPRNSMVGLFSCAFPVIVINAPLIRCVLDARGEMQLEEVEEGEFLFTGHELGTSIRVVTIAHLPTFATEAKQVAERLLAEHKADEEEFMRTSNRDHGVGQSQ
jgi:hypothetical protein